jgi:DNA-binding transcriptional LysR family regulator
MDHFKAMQSFVTVVECGSFSAAASQLGRPVSSVSRLMSELECELQAQLLHRTTRQLRLTEVGTLYLKECRHLLQGLGQARELVASYQQEPKGTLRICSMSSYGERVLIPALEGFSERYPEILLDVELNDNIQDIAYQGVDLAFRGGRLPEERLIAHRLADNRFLLCASPNYLTTYGTPQNELDLARHRAIYYRSPQGIIPWRIRDQAGEHIVAITPTLITNSTQQMLDQLRLGRGLCMAPRWSIAPYLNSGEVVLVPMEPAPMIGTTDDLGVYLLFPRSSYQIPKIRCAVDYFKNELTEVNEG